MSTSELLASLGICLGLSIVYITVGITYYKRGYKEGLAMGEAIGYHKRGRQDRIEAELKTLNFPLEQSSR